MGNNEYSRRRFMNRCFASVGVFFGGVLTFAGCNSDSPVTEETNQAKPGQPCDDLSGVSAPELEKRQNFGYVDKSPDPTRFCDNCGLHIPPASKTDCGGCMLFKGPVHPEGYCIQYVAKG